jgi:hypothetical protein
MANTQHVTDIYLRFFQRHSIKYKTDHFKHKLLRLVVQLSEKDSSLFFKILFYVLYCEIGKMQTCVSGVTRIV